MNDSKEVIIKKISSGELSLRDCSEELRDDKDVVLTAVNSNFSLAPLQFASTRLQDDKTIVERAVERSFFNFRYASERLRADKNMVLLALQGEVLYRFYAEQESYYQTDFNDSAVLLYASNDMQRDPELILKAASIYSLRKAISEWSEISFVEKFFYKTNKDALRGDDASNELKRREYLKQQVELEEQRTKEKVSKFEEYSKLRKEIEAMPEYKKWRSAILERDRYQCSICGKKENLEVDHRYLSFYSIVKKYNITNITEAYECSVLWNVNNGAVLCKDCHDKTQSSQRYFANNA